MLDRQFPGFAVRPGLRCPALFFEEIVFFGKLPVENGVVSLTNEIRLEVADRENGPECFARPTLQVLLSTLGPKAIALLYSAILQEERIVMVSSDLQKVSMSVIAAAAMAHPFALAATVLPILPATGGFASLLESPVPYLIGCTRPTNVADIVVDLDTGVVRSAVELKVVPNAQLLAEGLERLIELERDTIEIPPAKIRLFFRNTVNPAYDAFFAAAESSTWPSLLRLVPGQKYVFTAKFVQSAMSLFCAHVLECVRAVLFPCFVTDNTDRNLPVTVLNVDLLIRQFSDKDRPFWATFFRTQLFEMFVNRAVEDFKRQKIPAVHPCK
jgi:hypothetical protein